MPLSAPLEKEWLLTNRLGGYASTTVSGAHSRRYHSLFCCVCPHTGERFNLLSRFDETLVLKSGTRIELSTRRYQDVISPNGTPFLSKFLFDREKITIELTISTHELSAVLRRSYRWIPFQNRFEIFYEVLRANESFVLECSPFLAYRSYHALRSAESPFPLHQEVVGDRVNFSFLEPLNDFSIELRGATWRSDPDWYFRFYLREEEKRGFPFVEDLFTPGTLSVKLEQGSLTHAIVSTSVPAEAPTRVSAPKREQERQALFERLSQAAEQFLCFGADNHWKIIAGYHWFTDWGRDTFIALPGICLCLGKLEEARSIIERFILSERDGLIPNRFTDCGDTPEYNSADSALWLFYSVYHYYQTQGADRDFVLTTVLPVLEKIVAAFLAGTEFEIAVQDGLLFAGSLDTQLTWMDARVNGVPVTPRFGAAVELNALWFNALETLRFLYQHSHQPEKASTLSALSSSLRSRFHESFWSPERGYLLDVVGEDFQDASFRPNQLYALSLPFPIIQQPEIANSVLQRVSAELFTPYGLRTLSPADPRYVGHYAGGPNQRDAAYHQGTVWPFLLGTYFDSLFRFMPEIAQKDLASVQTAFERHLNEACIGQVSEIFDGDPPHAPRGCVGQAWSVAELLRVFDQHSKD